MKPLISLCATHCLSGWAIQPVVAAWKCTPHSPVFNSTRLTSLTAPLPARAESPTNNTLASALRLKTTQTPSIRFVIADFSFPRRSSWNFVSAVCLLVCSNHWATQTPHFNQHIPLRYRLCRCSWFACSPSSPLIFLLCCVAAVVKKKKKWHNSSISLLLVSFDRNHFRTRFFVPEQNIVSARPTSFLCHSRTH